MKNVIVLLIATLFALVSYAQKAEVLYFKANLPCCQATACDALQKEVQSVISKNFKKSEISLVVVKLADEANKSLIEKHNAKSQTLVLELKNNKKEAVDLSDILRAYLRNNDKKQLETAIVERIKQHLK
jgi:hypothetical protein